MGSFCAKNRETLSDELQRLLGARELGWLSQGEAGRAAPSTALSAAPPQRLARTGLANGSKAGLGGGARRGSMRQPSASEQFTAQLATLTASMRGGGPARAKVPSLAAAHPATRCPEAHPSAKGGPLTP